jgi:hypothetical protein
LPFNPTRRSGECHAKPRTSRAFRFLSEGDFILNYCVINGVDFELDPELIDHDQCSSLSHRLSAEMGARARQMPEEKFTKAQAMARWTELVDQLATASSRCSPDDCQQALHEPPRGRLSG